jgi:hypothetical protein
MFAVPQGDSGAHFEGLSDEAPIRLEGVPIAEFEALLFILYPVCVLRLQSRLYFMFLS